MEGDRNTKSEKANLSEREASSVAGRESPNGVFDGGEISPSRPRRFSISRFVKKSNLAGSIRKLASPLINKDDSTESLTVPVIPRQYSGDTTNNNNNAEAKFVLLDERAVKSKVDKPILVEHVGKQLHTMRDAKLMLYRIGKYFCYFFAVFVIFALVFALLLSFDSSLRWTNLSGELESVNLFSRIVYFLFLGLGGQPNVFGISADGSSIFANVVCTAAMYVGLTLKVTMIGVFMTLFSRPPAKVSFSSFCAVTNKSLSGLPALEFRILNERGFDKEVLQATVAVTLAITPKKGMSRRQFIPLRLSVAEQAHMPTIWTVSHIIDQHSPLFDDTHEHLVSKFAQIRVLFSGIDPMTLKEIYASHTYSASQILFDAYFANMVTLEGGEHPKVCIDYTKFHQVYVQEQHAEDKKRKKRTRSDTK